MRNSGTPHRETRNPLPKVSEAFLTPNPLYYPVFHSLPTNLPPNLGPSQLSSSSKEPDWLTFLKTNQNIYLDTETYSFSSDKNTMTNLKLRTIQFGPHYLIWEELSEHDQLTLIKHLVKKNIYCFNLNMDASQLQHAGFQVRENTWYDVALLWALC